MQREPPEKSSGAFARIAEAQSGSALSLLPGPKWLTLGLLALGFALRLARPEVHSFWIDEGLSLRIAQSADMIAALRDDSHPPLSFLVWRGWGALFGWSDLALRMLPALVSCASLVLFVPLAHAWLGARESDWAIALYAVSPLLVWIAHEVRMYAFVEMATLLTLIAARAAWRSRGSLRWVLLGVCTAAATGLHYYGSLVGLVVISQALVRWRQGALGRRDVIATGISCAAGVLVWTPWFLTILPAQYSNAWPRIARFSWRDLGEAPVRLFGVDFTALEEHGLAWVGWTLGVLCVVGCIAGAITVVARRTGNLLQDRVPREALCAAVVPIGASLVLAVLCGGGFQPRYLIVAVPGAIACIAAGLSVLRPAEIARTAGAALVAAALTACILQLSENRREDYRSVCREIAERWQPGDRLLVLVCVPPPCRLATVDHYLRERPDVLASVLDTDRYLAGDERVPAGTRIHVLWREATLCWEPFDRLRSTHRFTEDVPARFRIHRLVAIAP